MMLTAGLGTFVTYNPTSLRAEASLAYAAQLMDGRGIRHLPIVDSARRPIGILSDLDLSHELLHRSQTPATPSTAPRCSTVESLMVSRPLVIELQASPSAALEIILEHRIHSLPVVDDGRLVGMITSTDFLRELSYGELAAGQLAVADWMEPHDSNMIAPETTVLAALAHMQARRSEYLVVARRGVPAGILSLRDARRALQLNRNADHQLQTVATLLTGALPYVFGQANLKAAAGIMLSQRQKGLAVVGRNRQLQGLLTEDHILTALLDDLR